MREDYRPDIDGLRALAIVPVVAYHVGIPGFSGGYVGVDVFFVISGFLITGLLLKQSVATGRISLADFYARRMRRLAPAFGIVAIATLLLGMIFLSPFGPRQEMAKSAIAAGLFVSNFYFWLTTGGYFDGPVETMPFLHTWSLAVEEQYYAIWPALIGVAIGIARARSFNLTRLLLLILVAGIVASFAFSLYLTVTAPDAAFYLLPARIWQLGLGGALAAGVVLVKRASPALLGLMGIVGVSLIFVAVMFLDDLTPYPGTAALLPTLGALLVIASGTGGVDSLASRMLALPPLRFCGLVSYSWYLWHWPLLAMARAHTMDALPLGLALSLAATSFVLAAATYYFVEVPVRARKPWPFAGRASTIVTGTLISVGTAAIAIVVGMGARLDARRPEYEPVAAIKRQHRFHVPCLEDYPFDGVLSQPTTCTAGAGGSSPSIVLWGDSHANHLMPTIEGLATRRHVAVLERAMSGCPPVPDVEPQLGPDAAGGCAQFNAQVRAEIGALSQRGPVTVLLSARWPRYLLQEPVAQRERGQLFALNRGITTNQAALAELETGLQETVAYLRNQGADVLLVAPTPELRFPAAECLFRRPAAECSVPIGVIDDYRRQVMLLFARLADGTSGVDVWDPASELCDGSVCHSVIQNTVVYWDHDHLTVDAALMLVASADAVLLRLAGHAPVPDMGAIAPWKIGNPDTD